MIIGNESHKQLIPNNNYGIKSPQKSIKFPPKLPKKPLPISFAPNVTSNPSNVTPFDVKPPLIQSNKPTRNKYNINPCTICDTNSE